MRTVPSRYYVTPRITVDHVHGDALAPADAADMVRAGVHVILRDEQTARDTLSCFDMTQEEIDSAIRFGQTGQV